jgi:dihydroorotase
VSEKLNYRGIPNISESSIIARDLMFIQSYRNLKYHVQHISASESVKLVTRAKKHLENIFCEVCPHHFILTDKDCLKYGTNAKMNPPLRTEKDIGSIINALKNNVIDVISSDHAPHTKFEKSMNFEQAPFGIIGLETSIALSYTYLVEKRIISFENMIHKMSINPRKILNLPQNFIKTGEKANLTLLKTNEKWEINSNKFKSKGRNTPFSGFKVTCKPFAVINNNKIYFSDL